jgi:hypothetical protein
MITVIGKLKDTQQYIGRDGFCVLANRPDWSEQMQAEFIETAMREGHALLFASWQADGQYRNELAQILARLLDAHAQK